jgi:hypothetical protein
MFAKQPDRKIFHEREDLPFASMDAISIAKVAQVGLDKPRSITPSVAVVMPASWATASWVRPLRSRICRIAFPRAGWGLSEGATAKPFQLPVVKSRWSITGDISLVLVASASNDKRPPVAR